MSFSKTLLAGVSVCAMSAVPALARDLPPNIHLSSIIAKGHPSQRPHMKTNVHDPKATNYTVTYTFTASIPKSDYKTPITLLGETWLDSCTQPTKQAWKKLKDKKKAAKLTTGTSTGTISSCSGTTFTFQDIIYDLTSKTATKDEVTGELIAKNFDGYNLKLNAIIDITITK
jgi:hypothetical protein